MAHGWLAQQRRGAIVEWVPAGGETLPIEAYEASIDERTLVVPVAHVCFRNGHRIDVAALAALCRARGAYLMLDDYQRTGTAPLDVHALGVDFLVTGALKYLLRSGRPCVPLRAPRADRGARAVVDRMVRPRRPLRVQPRPLDWAASARRFETGTPPVPNAYAAAAGLDLLNALGTDGRRGADGRLTNRTISGARRRGFAVATPDNPGQRGALYVVVRCTDAATLVGRLAARRDRGVGPGHRPPRFVPRLQHRRRRGRSACRARCRGGARRVRHVGRLLEPLFRRHEPLQLLDPVLHDDDARRRSGPVGAALLDHQEPLAVG